MKTVYSYYVLDILHQGHLAFMKKAKQEAGKNGISIVGILTDEAAMEKKSKPIMSLAERVEIARAIKYVDRVVVQNTYLPIENIKTIKPDILLESTSHDSSSIERMKNCMKEINGNIVVVPYFSSQSSTAIKNKIISQNNRQ